MADLKTKYMGLTLKNPVIVASSGKVATVEGVQKADDAGAGAVVLKSLFEEQIRMETAQTAAGVSEFAHPEASAYLESEVWMRYGPRDYTKLIENCKKNVSIPVIASINCVSGQWWTDYAKDMEAAGADGIELNVLVPGTDPNVTSAEVEQIYIDTVGAVAKAVSIPVAAKIGFSFASLANMAKRLVDTGAQALVLFNRFHRPDIDIDRLSLKSASPFSNPVEMHFSLRWIGLLSGTVNADLAATTGLHEAEHVIKQLLAGATVAQVCSTIYKNGFEQISKIIAGIEAWMGQHDYESIDDFRGRFSHQQADAPAVYERRQYIKHLVGIS